MLQTRCPSGGDTSRLLWRGETFARIEFGNLWPNFKGVQPFTHIKVEAIDSFWLSIVWGLLTASTKVPNHQRRTGATNGCFWDDWLHPLPHFICLSHQIAIHIFWSSTAASVQDSRPSPSPPGPQELQCWRVPRAVSARKHASRQCVTAPPPNKRLLLLGALNATSFLRPRSLGDLLYARMARRLCLRTAARWWAIGGGAGLSDMGVRFSTPGMPFLGKI